MHTHCFVMTGEEVQRLTSFLLTSSQWFEVTPLPDSEFEIRVKEENIRIVRQFMMNNNYQIEYGKIQLMENHSFIWHRMPSGEISGHIEKPDSSVLKGSFGFWRTNDQQKAAELAQDTFLNQAL